MTKEQLNDPIWRICNLYTIVDKDGNAVIFKPNPAQLSFLKAFKRRNLILKARQLGFSTLIQILMLDQCIFLDNIHAGVIAQDEEAASKIFRDKIKFAWEHMPSWVHLYRTTVGDSARELEFDNGSTIRVATSMRSTTLQYLHVSEFGKICAKTPMKAKEVVTGSIPTLGDSGFCFIESTAEGREGKFFEMVQDAQKRQRAGIPLGPKDFKLHFYSWHDCPDYKQDFEEPLEPNDLEYFTEIESLLEKNITPQQRYWYVTTRRTIFAGDTQMMKQEYPSLPDEAFEQSSEGCWFSTQMITVRRENRITNVAYQPGYPVDTFWDIGRTDGTAIWMMQKIGIDYRFIRFIEGWDDEFDKYVAEMNKFSYVWGKHYLPHDAKQVRQAKNKQSSTSAEKILNDLGLKPTVIVPVTPTKILAINKARSIIPQCYFDEKNCALGIAHLDGYHKIWDTVHGCWSSVPDHDVHSEAADAFMQFAQGWKQSTTIDQNLFLQRNNNFSPFR